MPRKHRFLVQEFSSGYSLFDRMSQKSHWLSDGVDVLHTVNGKAMIPGSEYFRKTWERFFNDNEEETCKAYDFPSHEIKYVILLPSYHRNKNKTIIKEKIGWIYGPFETKSDAKIWAEKEFPGNSISFQIKEMIGI